eukprot:s225_g24.t1
MALAAALQRVSFTGACLSEEHVTAVTERIVCQIMLKMLHSNEPVYGPKFAASLGGDRCNSSRPAAAPAASPTSAQASGQTGEATGGGSSGTAADVWSEFRNQLANLTQKFITQFAEPKRLENNMENTKHLEPLWLDADLYTIGSPCQSWSVAGAKGGASDVKGSLMALIPYQITKHKPRSFISENVKGLMSLFPKEFNWLIESLRAIRLANGEPCNPATNEKRNLREMTHDVDGLALSNTVRKNLNQFQEFLEKNPDKLDFDFIVDTGGSKATWMQDTCPCLTASRCKGKHGYWWHQGQRFLKPRDFFLLQGVWPGAYKRGDGVLAKADLLLGIQAFLQWDPDLKSKSDFELENVRQSLIFFQPFYADDRNRSVALAQGILFLTILQNAMGNPGAEIVDVPWTANSYNKSASVQSMQEKMTFCIFLPGFAIKEWLGSKD